jgi:hypothetical protein
MACWLAGWLIVSVSVYIIDCLKVTYLAKLRLDLPWYERGIFAGGPAGILSLSIERGEEVLLAAAK